MMEKNNSTTKNNTAEEAQIKSKSKAEKDLNSDQNESVSQDDKDKTSKAGSTAQDKSKYKNESEGNELGLTKEEKLQEEVQTQKDKYLRLFAEFENYKRRTSKERLELFKTASQELMQAMLPVLDDFDRALKEIKKSDDDNLVEGVELISNKFNETLKSKGLEPMHVKIGDTFDGDIHEAVTQIPAPEKAMKGKIVDVVEKGYTLGEKIIRFPKVVTGK